MRKAVMIVLALLAIRLLPRTARREARMIELVTLLAAAAIASGAPNSSKAYATEQRTARVETTVGTMKSQRGTVGSFGASVPNLSGTITGTAGTGGVDRSAQVTEQASTTSSGQTSTALTGQYAHYHDYGGHNHGYDHTHSLLLTGEWNTFASSYDATLATVIQMKAALVAAGIL